MGMLTPFTLALWLVVAAPPDPQALELESRQIETMLIAPCCWTQQVSLHQSAAADEIKANIRKMLAQNMTRRQILDAYVAEYGDRILAEPPARGFSAALYVLPWVFLAGSIGIVVVVIRHLRAPVAPAAAAAQPVDRGPTSAGESEAETERLDEELRNLD